MINISALVEKKAQLPLQLQPHEVACEQESQKLERLQADVGQLERQQRASERELADSQVALTKTQAKLRELKPIKNIVRYSLRWLQQSNVSLTWKISILQLMEQTEQQRQLLQMQEQGVRAARQQLQEQKHHLQEAARIFKSAYCE